MTDLIREAKALLQELDASPRKKLGQNFMVSPETLCRIPDATDLKSGETILEIGPGLGFLTRVLLEKGVRVLAVEKDRAFTKYLRTVFHSQPFQVFERDILGFDLKQALGSDKSIKAVGNIPYNLTSPLLEWLVFQRRQVCEAVLTVQREVALRLLAQPGTKAWGALSIFMQVYSKPSMVQRIPKAHFYPVPKVDSAIIKLVLSNVPLYPIQNEENFFALVRRAFQKRRKTILNALRDDRSEAFSRDLLSAALERTQIKAVRRPETLTIHEWVRLADLLPVL